ncbi:RidA family protein [Xanthobacter sp. DSM 24535]|uniref:RidA family protein n=1 Tax=Roseixanthobacter psychrophilus TaxID=3119917 RepID=UPI00372933AF
MRQASSPPPQGHYVPARRHNDLVFVSGMTPRRNGVLLYTGQVAADAPAEMYEDAVQLATHNALQAAEGQLQNGERIASVLSLTVFVNAPTGYTRHSQIADIASRHIQGCYGAALPSRAAIGVASLPGNAVVEVSLIARLCSDGEQ